MRHKNKFFVILFWILVIITKTIKAETASNLEFNNLNINKQLPTNEVRNLYQDHEGYIWISTYNGLLRYDGYSIINYKNTKSINQENYIDNFINSVCEDTSHKLWIGTHNGLYCLDKETEDIERVTSAGLHTFFIETVKCTSNGSILVGSTQGLYIKEKNKTEFRRMFPSTSMDVKSILEDDKNNIWIGTWSQGLFRYNPSEKKLYNYPDTNPGKSAHSLYQDKKGNIWIGTWRYGLIKIINPYNMEKYSFVSYKNNPNDPSSISDNIIYTINQDNSSDNLWIGTRSGLSIMNTDKSTFTNYTPNTPGCNINNGEVNAILCSKDGLMWIGMLGGGISTVNIKEKQFGYDALKNIQKNNSTSVRCIYKEENQDILWLGIMGFGFGKYNTRTKEFINYKKIPEFSHLPYISVVNEISFDKNSRKYYLSTWDDGVWIFNGKEVEAINHDKYPNMSDVCIYTTLIDNKGNLWVGSRSGLFILNNNNKLYSINEFIDNNNQQIPAISIFKLTSDEKGNIWAATTNHGVYKISEANGRYITQNYSIVNGNADIHGAMTLLSDSKNNIWVGTNGNGLRLYDAKTDRFKSMFQETLDSNEVIYCLLEDNNGNLWFTTNNRMYNVINPTSDKESSIHIYTVEDGLQDYIFNRNSCHKGSNGELYFGGVKGLNIFSPENIIYDKSSYQIAITDFKIYNRSVRESNIKYCETSKAKSLDYIDHIILNYKNNNFSLDFSLLNYINPQLNRYEYQLKGYDKNWIPTDAERNFAYYNNLPSGKYLFMVKGANSNGEWSENIRSLKITILPPPWLTWWAYCVYITITLTIAFIIYKVIKKRMYLQQMIELAKIQVQKEEEINHSKLQFFTNITHELLTPLTIISASVEDIKRHVPSVSGRLQEIEDNSQRLIRLIQQILEFRKVENNKQQLRVSYGSMTQLIKHSCMAFAPLVRKKKLELHFIDGGYDYKGFFDTDKVDKILYNLLSNASKYTLKGNIITLSQSYDELNKKFTFSVNNPGEVIPKEKIEHIFERFYEGEYRRFNTIGTGIGLSLTKDLTTLHHGEIKVESSVEDGITFTVSIPVGKDAFTEDEFENDKKELIEREDNFKEDNELIEKGNIIEENKEIQKLSTVLLVEDNEELIDVVSRILSDQYSIIKANNGEQALEELRLQKVDIIVSDVMMEGMNGFELCKNVKETFETKHIPVILITARTSDQDRIEGYKVGADGYICKPLNINVLIAKINNLLQKGSNNIIDSRKQLVFEAKEIDYTEQDEILLKKVIECVNEHLDDMDFDIPILVEFVGMSRTVFTDKMKQLTGMTPLAFVSSIRLQAAFRLLQEKKHIRITELAYSVGFNDPKYFSQCFKKKFGFSPKEFQKEKSE